MQKFAESVLKLISFVKKFFSKSTQFVGFGHDLLKDPKLVAKLIEDLKTMAEGKNYSLSFSDKFDPENYTPARTKVKTDGLTRQLYFVPKHEHTLHKSVRTHNSWFIIYQYEDGSFVLHGAYTVGKKSLEMLEHSYKSVKVAALEPVFDEFCTTAQEKALAFKKQDREEMREKFLTS